MRGPCARVSNGNVKALKLSDFSPTLTLCFYFDMCGGDLELQKCYDE